MVNELSVFEPLKVYCITCLYFAHAFQVATGDEWVEIFFFLCPTDPLSNSEQFRQTLGLQNRVLSRTFNIRYKFFCQFLCLFLLQCHRKTTAICHFSFLNVLLSPCMFIACIISISLIYYIMSHYSTARQC